MPAKITTELKPCHSLRSKRFRRDFCAKEEFSAFRAGRRLGKPKKIIMPSRSTFHAEKPVETLAAQVSLVSEIQHFYFSNTR